VKAIDQRLGLWIGLGVETLTRMSIAPEKALEPEHIAILSAADDYGPTGACLQQTNTPENQGAHDALAELGFCNQEGPQLVGRDDQRVDRCSRVGVHQRRPARELRQFTHEMRDDRGGAARLVTPSDVDVSSQDDAEAQTNLTDGRERFAHPVRADLAKAPYPLDLGRLQNRKHLLPSCLDDGLGRSTDHLCKPASGLSSGTVSRPTIPISWL
jgi:hypothetical protein